LKNALEAPTTSQVFILAKVPNLRKDFPSSLRAKFMSRPTRRSKMDEEYAAVEEQLGRSLAAWEKAAG
jgi:hypothetical protein